MRVIRILSHEIIIDIFSFFFFFCFIDIPFFFILYRYVDSFLIFYNTIGSDVTDQILLQMRAFV